MYILVSVIYFLKNAKHNIFVNHTNLLYSVQIKMIFFCQKQLRFCFFLQETRSNNFGEWISYLDLKKLVFFLHSSWYRCLVGQCGLGSLCLTLSLIYIVYIFCVILRHQILYSLNELYFQNFQNIISIQIIYMYN